MNHPDPHAFVDQFKSLIERLDRHRPLGGSAKLPVFDVATTQNGFAAASGGAS